MKVGGNLSYGEEMTTLFPIICTLKITIYGIIFEKCATLGGRVSAYRYLLHFVAKRLWVGDGKGGRASEKV